MRAALALNLTREQALYLAVGIAAFVLRIWEVGSRAMHGDESVHAWLAWNLYTGAGYQYDPVYHGPLQFLVTSVFFFLFSPSNTSARLMAVLFGSALVVLPYFLRRYMGRWAALLAAAFIGFSPAFVYVSRLERDDIFTCLFGLTMALGLLGLARTGQARYLYLLVASAALSLAAMENTYITLFIFGSYLAVVLLSEWQAQCGGLRWWRATGSDHRISGRILGAYLLLLLAALLLTMVTGLYLPVPLVLAVGIVGLVSRQTALGVMESGETPYLGAIRGVPRQAWVNALALVVAILFLAFSAFGEDPRGIWDATQPFFNTGSACPGNPFILNPCRKDIIGGLFYWLSQHEVHRGGQPWFYYTLLFGLYEQIAVLFGAAGAIWFARRPSIFSSFVTFWAILAFGVYSWAGEKFPWLMIHPLLPVTLLAAMFAVDAVRRLPRARVWIVAILAVLTVIELHSMWEVNFINGANPVEMMVYVQSSPQTPVVADDILRLSHKVTNGKTLHVTIDSLDTWPFAWYLRDMPNVAYPAYPQLMHAPYSTNPVILVDEQHQPLLYPKLKGKYTGRRYRLRWWFPEDYKQLTWTGAWHDAVNPGDWRVILAWLFDRRPFGPRHAVWFYYYVRNGLASPY